VTSCGRPVESDVVAKAGMAGREGVVGGAFSLSVACDSWLCDGFWGRGVESASAGAAVDDAGGLGKSLTICACRQILRYCNGCSNEWSYLIQAVQDVLKRLGPFCSALRASIECSTPMWNGTYESSAPSSAAFCRMVSAARDQQGA
jgi:hypothetical protein